MSALLHRNALTAGAVAGVAIVLVQGLGRRAAAGLLSLEVYGGLVAMVCCVATWLLLRERRKALPLSPLDRLTQRERQILELIAQGKANKEIAVALGVEVSTIKTHANNLFTKLQCANRREAQRLWEELTASPPSFHPRSASS